MIDSSRWSICARRAVERRSQTAVRAARLAVGLVIAVHSRAYAQPPVVAGGQAAACAISGTVTSGTARLPGTAITVVPADGGTPVASSSWLDGTFVVAVPGPGRYQIKAELAGFAPATRDLTLGADCQARVDLTLVLASRVPAVAAVPQQARTAQSPRSNLFGGLFQQVGVVADAVGAAQRQALAGTVEDEADRALAQLSLPPGFALDTLSETLPARGATGQINELLLFGARLDGSMLGLAGMPAAAGSTGAAGAGLAGLGELAELGRLAGLMKPAGQGGPLSALSSVLSLANEVMSGRPRGLASYLLGASPLDARPYALGGQAAIKPDYLRQRYTFSAGGRLKVPKLFDAGPRTFYFASYSGERASNLSSQHLTVPTQAARAGDFSWIGAPLIDPMTGLLFPGNRIPDSRISQAARTLLAFFPEPNQPDERQNFHHVTTSTSAADDVTVRVVRTFIVSSGPQPGGPRAGRPGAGGGRSLPGLGALSALAGTGGRGRTLNLNAGFRYHRTARSQPNAFPTLTSLSRESGVDIPVSLGFAAWGFQHNLRAGFNRSTSETTNNLAFVRDVAGEAGLAGVAVDPFDWGVPALSFSSVSSLRDATPVRRRTQTVTVADSLTRTRGRHTFRLGGDFRDVRIDSREDTSARGSFVFTGLYTSGGSPVSGSDFADFLLGLPQQASVQYGPGLARFRSRAWNLYVQDDWRVTNYLTVNAGLRYEYESPVTEADNRLVTLDVAPDFSAAVAVRAGEAGPFTGRFPASIVEADRNNLAPRIGLAWRPKGTRTTVRGGYGINYASVPYRAIGQRLAGQPPFAVTDTRIGSLAAPLTLADAFGAPSAAVTKNNFGVDRHYRIGYAQIWNADVQRSLTRTIVLGVSYTGTKGSQLDLQRAPNRGPSGLRTADVQPFIWQSSGARSIMHALSVRVNRGLAQGFSGGAVYTLSRSRDNASTIGGGVATVAQNDQDLEAEWGLSSFDQRHRLSADATLDLPFGERRRWLNRDGLLPRVLGGWTWSVNLQAASGTPYTARVLGDVRDVARGTNGTLRADSTGAPIAVAHPTTMRFFNTAAFAVPAPGTFGNAPRNSIRGPANATLNMSLMKNVTMSSLRGVSVRVQATNVLNSPQWASIDTVVNSPTFGRVTAVRPMRSVQVIARVMF